MRPVALELEANSVRTDFGDKDPLKPSTCSPNDGDPAPDTPKCGTFHPTADITYGTPYTNPTAATTCDPAYPDATPLVISPGRSPEPRPGSSCYALRAAVGLLVMWDDFDAEKIGEGFFADVYKIRRKTDGHVMVAKVGKQTRWRTNQHKMMQELELLNKLRHPNVVRYIGACVKEGHIHPVLEYVSGGSLAEILADRALALSWRQKGNLATDIARGMAFLHTKNVCHRDLTSGNCLVRRKPNDVLEAVLTDFGLARLLSRMPDPPPNTPRTPDFTESDEFDGGSGVSLMPSACVDIPRKMSVVGTAFWMAPEMLRGEEYTRQVDVFSYGIVVCEIVARITADPEDLPRTGKFGLDINLFREKCPGIPQPLLEIAEECCSMDPRERPVFLQVVRRLEIIRDLLDTEKIAPRSYNVNLTDIILTNGDPDDDPVDYFHFGSKLPWMISDQTDGTTSGDDTFNGEDTLIVDSESKECSGADGDNATKDNTSTEYQTLNSCSLSLLESLYRIMQYASVAVGFVFSLVLTYVMWTSCDVSTGLLGTSMLCACVGWALETNLMGCAAVLRVFAKVAPDLIWTLWKGFTSLLQKVQYDSYARCPSSGADLNKNSSFANQNGDISRNKISSYANQCGGDLANNTYSPHSNQNGDVFNIGNGVEVKLNGSAVMISDPTPILIIPRKDSLSGILKEPQNGRTLNTNLDSFDDLRKEKALMMNGKLARKRVSFSLGDNEKDHDRDDT